MSTGNSKYNGGNNGGNYGNGGGQGRGGQGGDRERDNFEKYIDGLNRQYDPKWVAQQKCHRCGEKGHLERECPQETERDPRSCYHCGQVGHLKMDCPLLGGVGRRF